MSDESVEEREVGRVRRLVASLGPDAAEKKMFGGTTFLLRGNMLCSVSTRGLMIRVGKDAEQAVLAHPFAKPCLGAGRRMAGFILIEPDGVNEDDQLQTVLDIAIRYVGELPAKTGRRKPESPSDGHERRRPLNRPRARAGKPA